MAGKLQNSDHKSLTELQGLGADKEQLLNTDKIYTAKSDEVLETTLRKNNFAAIVDPTENDDSTQNYEVGSRWINTDSGARFELIDNTAGAAVWKKGGSGGEGRLNFVLIGSQEEAVVTDYERGNDPTFGTVNMPFAGGLTLSDVDPFRGEFSLLYENAATTADSDEDWFYRDTNVPQGYRRESLLDFEFQYNNLYADGNIKVHLIELPSNNVLVEEGLNNHVSGPLGDAAEFSRRVALRDDTTTLRWGFSVVTGEASASFKIDDVIITPELGFIEQNVISQRPDTSKRVNVGNGFGSTQTNIRRFANLVDDFGADVEYVDSATDGASFTIKKDGIYHVSYTDQAGVAHLIGISKNADGTTVFDALASDQQLAGQNHGTGTYANFSNIAWSGYLKEGDVIKPHGNGTIADPTSPRAEFSISRQGATERFAPAIDQKITIPTSKLILQNQSSSSFTDSRLLYQNQLEFSGEGFTYDNSDGTLIKVQKDGIMHIDASTFCNNANNFNIRKNGVVLSLSRHQASSYNAGSITVVVKAGDELDVILDNAGAGTDAVLAVTHQETEVSVGINTIVPQYEDQDSMVRVINANGYGSGNPTIRRFASVVNNIGSDVEYIDSASDGASFTIKEKGIYHISYTEVNSGGNSDTFAIVKNSTNKSIQPEDLVPQDQVLAIAGIGTADGFETANWTGILEEGDEIVPQSQGTLDNDLRVQFTITKMALPSIVGIDGKKLEVFTKDEDSMIRLNTAIGYGSVGNKIRRFSNIVENQGSAILYEDSAVNGASFTAQEDGVYHITYSDANNAALQAIVGLSKNSTELSTVINLIAVNDRLTTGSAHGGSAVDREGLSWTGVLKKGDVIRPHSDGDLNGTTEVTFTMTKIGELRQIIPLENQTVEIPSSLIALDRAAGLGSVNTRVVHFNSVLETKGEGLIFENSTSNGFSATVQKDGFIFVQWSFAFQGVEPAGITLNDTELTLGIDGMSNTSNIKASSTNDISNAGETVSWSGQVKAGDVIRFKNNSAQVPSVNDPGRFGAHILLIENQVEVAINNIEPQYEDIDSMVQVSGQADHGSGNFIERFSKVESVRGDDIEYVDDAVVGASFIVKKTGFYAISYTSHKATDSDNGISVNSDELSTNIASLNNTRSRLALVSQSSAERQGFCSWAGVLNEGDVVRAHGDGASPGSNPQRASFTIARMGHSSIVGVDEQEFIQIEEEADSGVSLSSTNGHGSVATRIRRFSNLQDSYGNAIRYIDSPSNGAAFEILEDGIYNISYTDIFNLAGHFGITKNAPSLTADIFNVDEEFVLSRSITETDGRQKTTSWTGRLSKGDIIRPHTDAAAEDGLVERGSFHISKQGKTKVSAVPEAATIELPTSEIIMNQYAGTSGDFFLKFAALSSLTGEGLTLRNNTQTEIHVEKDGILSLTANVFNNTAGRELYTIDINGNSRGGQLGGDVVGSNIDAHLGWTGKVFAGDVIKIKQNGGNAPVSSFDRNILKVIHIQTEINAAINNVQPQYEEADSMVSVETGNGFGSSNTAIRRFVGVAANLGTDVEYQDSAADGGSFTIKKSGFYHISYSDIGQSGSYAIALTKNSTNLTTGPQGFVGVAGEKLAMEFGEAGFEASLSWSGYLKENDVIRAHGDPVITFNDSPGLTLLTIGRQASPSVIGIDGRPVDAFRQEPDSVFRAEGLANSNGLGTATDSKVVTFLNVKESEGNAIEYIKDLVNGDSWVIKEDGLYFFDIGIRCTVQGQELLVVKNSPDRTLFASVLANTYPDNILGGSLGDFSFGLTEVNTIAQLKKGDVITLQVQGSDLNTSSYLQQNSIAIGKIGDIKRVSTTIDSTVQIPTSEIRLQASNSLGTGTEANTVQFQELSNLSGDGLTILNSNGSVVRVEKDGVLAVSCSLERDSSSGSVFNITKNQANAAAPALANEIQAVAFGSDNGSAGQLRTNMSSTFKVKAGDLIRINTQNSGRPPTDDIANHVTFSLVETEVGVAISNIDPEFEGAQSMIRLQENGNGSAGYGSVNTAIKRFVNVLEKIGDDIVYEDSATLGASFTVTKSGFYAISMSGATDNAFLTMGITKNSTALSDGVLAGSNNEARLAHGTFSGAGEDQSVAWAGYLAKGDVIRPHGDQSHSVTVRNNRWVFTMARMGQPNVTGLDVTQFIEGVANEKQLITHTAAKSTILSTDQEWRFNIANIVREGENILRVEDDSSGARTKFVATKDCIVHIAFSGISLNNNSVALRLFKNGVEFHRGATNNSAVAHKGTSATTMLRAGDYVSVGTNANETSSADPMFLNIVAQAENSSVVSESDIFDSDNIDFVYKVGGLTAQDPVGSFTVYDYNTPGSNAATPRASHTQTSSQMNTDGILISCRPSNDGAQPNGARVDIQVGKGRKSVDVFGYGGSGRINPLSLDRATSGTAVEAGISRSYDETTGILSIDAGYFLVSSTSRILSSFTNDVSSGSGYFVIKSSAKAPLVNIPKTKIAYIRDVKAPATNPQSMVAGVNIREINTIDGDTSIVSISGNQFTLQPGVYDLDGSVQGWNTSEHKGYIHNVNTGLTEITGTTAYPASNFVSDSFIKGTVTIEEETVFEIRQWAVSGGGMGGIRLNDGGAGNNVYTQLGIRKLI